MRQVFVDYLSWVQELITYYLAWNSLRIQPLSSLRVAGDFRDEELNLRGNCNPKLKAS